MNREQIMALVSEVAQGATCEQTAKIERLAMCRVPDFYRLALGAMSNQARFTADFCAEITAILLPAPAGTTPEIKHPWLVKTEVEEMVLGILPHGTEHQQAQITTLLRQVIPELEEQSLMHLKIMSELIIGACNEIAELMLSGLTYSPKESKPSSDAKPAL